MATLGFNVSDEVKKAIDHAIDDFVATHGGKKSDFVTAMVDMYQEMKAKEELSGRREEIERFEGLLASIRTAYVYSLSVAKDAASDNENLKKAVETISEDASKKELQSASLQERILELEKEIEQVQQEKAAIAKERDDYVRVFVEERDRLQSKVALAERYEEELREAKGKIEELEEKLKKRVKRAANNAAKSTEV